ncbi:9404_t:CDS:2 [Acaulospora morrowiae]|uniref:Chitin synthase n=1 Tax=Acaulospora morrowiae TaxID=94023 RepID=A0A9N8WAE2_9GLOM|nr:9404_t:CDS:2 [Acaulospora morrowiae]
MASSHPPAQDTYQIPIPHPPPQDTNYSPSSPHPTFHPETPGPSTIIDIIESETITDETKFHYGQSPAYQPRRDKTKKRVKLHGENYVTECPVPTNFKQMIPRKDEKEFSYMRYTACTCKPDDFEKKGYTLRQSEFDPPRSTELFIVLTMFNEKKEDLARTFHGVMKNISHLCSRKHSKVWDKGGWKKVVVCIVSDGRKFIKPCTLAYLAAIGVYQDGVEKGNYEVMRSDGTVENRKVTAHIYEYTTQVSIDTNMEFEKENIVPIQVIFCLKEENAQKINSHRWFFNAFGKILKPKVCVLLDVGTKPGSTSIHHLWKAFKNDNVAGACGEIIAMKGNAGVFNPIVAAQNFEYKMSNILDKPLESVMGYITVLPGAFSAYRYTALQNDDNGKGPLNSYFACEVEEDEEGDEDNSEKNEKKKVDKEDLFTANMYLAEDRILCFELVTRRDSAYVLHYVKSAYAETDVPNDVAGLIKQRRRWLNGSYFASLYALRHCLAVWRSHHSPIRKFVLFVEMLYQLYNLLFTWFGLALTPDALLQVLSIIYIILIVVQIILAMGNRPQSSKWAYIVSMIFFALIMIYMLFAAGWITYKGVALQLDSHKDDITGANVSTANALLEDQYFRNIVLSVICTYGLYFVSSFLFLEPWHMFSSIIQYLLLVPFYVNVLTIYAFCNVHDVSWGTREAKSARGSGKVVQNDDSSSQSEMEVEVEAPVEEKDINKTFDEAVNAVKESENKKPTIRSSKEKKEDKVRTFRTRFVLAWLITNVAFVFGIQRLPQEKINNTYVAFILWSVAGLAAFRFIV